MTAGDPLTSAGLIEFLKGQLSGPAAEQLGRAAGFSGNTATRATQAALPVVLNAVANRGQTEAGAADLLTRSRDLERLTDAGGTLNTALLNDPAEIARLEGQGRGLLGSLLPNVDEVTGRLGSAVGGSGASAGRLLALLAPLVLGLVAGRARSGNVNPAGLSSLLGGVGPLLPALLPAGLTSLTPLLAPPVIVETVAVAVPPPPRLVEPPPAVPVTTTTVTTARRGGFPWWLIPLLLLLLLGGCWLLQNRPAVAPAAVEGGASVAAGLVITEPQDGAEVPASGFSMRGTGPAGETYQLFRDDAEVGTINVGEDGTWNVDVVGEATEVGEQTYSVRAPDGTEVASLPVTAVPAGDGAAPTEDGTGAAASPADSATELTITQPQDGAEVPASGFSMQGTGPAGESYVLERDGAEVGTIDVGEDGTWNVDIAPEATDVGEQTYSVRTPDGTEVARLPLTGVPLTGAVDAATTPGLPEVTVTEPARGAEVPATGFDITGTGPAGTTLELVEDEVGGTDDSTLGSFTVGEDGTWTADVPSPTAGDKVYVIRTPDGTEIAALPLTVVPAPAAAACTTALTLSLDEGERVSAPFRFGGVGNAESYTVTVRRGERVVGTQPVELTPECTWSYVSDPGGREGTESQVTYEIRPGDAASTDPALTQATLTVSGSGTNFNAAGEYVGPLGSN